MMRFIDLGKQIAVDETDPDYPRQFAFYNTASGEFIELAQMGHVWDSWIDILRFAGDEDPKLLDRLWGLSPEWSKCGLSMDVMRVLPVMKELKKEPR